ncbi:hypothetical protein PMAYCL1PPCAC_25942 [Pristionchus mayeri]|uniref:Uncharacterized protein n=1 Tax=Pristionchus mayeri TaxID=1317129 RepID=A0AAN5D4V1_9BILA|nr:hypothetical protein PMAYCL1PPCAC_25942 [Pristionchus mayeri]
MSFVVNCVATTNGEPPVKRKRGRPKTISNDSDDEWFSGPSSSKASKSATPLIQVQQGPTLADLLGVPDHSIAVLSSSMDLTSPSAIASALSSINHPPGDQSPAATAGPASNNNNNNNGNRLQSVFGELATAFTATVARDYEKAAKIVRDVVKSDHAFGADELELIDHVFACVLNTAHYDETMIEVCWEWIHCLEREPRCVEARVIASSQLSVYYAYHTISRVQERMPRKPDFAETRASTWAKANESFRYFWRVACAVWRPFELDRIDVLVNWTYLALQFADAVTDEEIRVIESQTLSTRAVLGKSIVVEHAHQTNERFATVERNLKEIVTARIEKRRRSNSITALKLTSPGPAAVAVSAAPAAHAPAPPAPARKTLAGAIDSLVSKQREAAARVKVEEVDTD